MSTYSPVLKTPGVAGLLYSQLVARFPSGMLSLVLIMHIERVFGSYTIAGATVGAFSLGAAVSGPLTSRWMGRFGIRPVLAVTTVICTASIVAIALVPLPAYGCILVGAVMGFANPPIQPAVRTIYPKMVNARLLTPLFSLDAALQEVIWVIGPVLATFVASQFAPSVALLLSAVILVFGGAWFFTRPALGEVRIPVTTKTLGKVLLRPPVFFSTIVGLLLIAACGAVEAGTVAALGDHGLAAGVVLAAFSVGSLGGGLALGRAAISPWSLARRSIAVAAGMALCVVSQGGIWLGAMLFIAGLGVSPVLAVIFASVSSSVRFSDTAEAYGWVGTGQLMGAAAGSAVAGFMIDHSGVPAAFAAAAAFGVATLLVSLIAVRWLPDLRVRTPGPIPDTAPIAVPREI